MATPIVIIFRLRLDKGIETFVVGCLEVYCCEVIHNLILFIFIPHAFNLSGNLFAKPHWFQNLDILPIP